MSNDNGNDKNENDFEKKIEQKCEAWGNNVDQKADAFVKSMPAPVNALLDAVCISVLLIGLAWVTEKFSSRDIMPTWNIFGIIFGAIFVISLLYRLVMKARKK